MLNETSSINFTAYQAPLHYQGRCGVYGINTHKAIVRIEDNKPDQPRCIGVVGKDWKLIQNRDVFNSAETALWHELGEDRFRKLEVVDKMSHDGSKCWREYRLRDDDIKLFDPNAKIGYRVIVKNGFDGSTSVGMIFGVIDFFCTNGMIAGQFDDLMKKHTSRLDHALFVEPVRQSLRVYEKQVADIVAMAQKKVAYTDVDEFFKSTLSERLAKKMRDRFVVEQEQRGLTLWSVVSALTYYSSHNSDEFPVRRSADNDNEASSLYQRQTQVRLWMQGDNFKRLAA